MKSHHLSLFVVLLILAMIELEESQPKKRQIETVFRNFLILMWMITWEMCERIVFFHMSCSSTFLPYCSFYLSSKLFSILRYVTAAAVWSRRRVGRWEEKFSKCCCSWSEHRGEASDSVCFQNKRLVPSHILPVSDNFHIQLFVVLFNKCENMHVCLTICL